MICRLTLTKSSDFTLEAFTYLQNILKLMEHQPECDTVQLLAVKYLQDLIARKQVSSSKRRTLLDYYFSNKRMFLFMYTFLNVYLNSFIIGCTY